ncbi:MAG: 23S rRNA (adenine(2503)-C(2))-methyltransferase RlmN [Flavobacteriaceae bacterium]|nr:23S rRNA (adenine(2503)-C(2))-methyltransferase RlmN [Flavobacteriaceae bacterium]
MTEKKDIRALSLEQLRDYFVHVGEQAFRGNQVYEWLWQKGAHDFSAMTNLSEQLRTKLNEAFVINHIAVDVMQKSSDGTIKNSVKLHDGLVVESVLIPTDNRTTACVSSQVGCSLNCSFCATARLKRMRNLNPDEIFDQVVAIDRQSKLYYQRPLSNIVFMGMGEPLMNYPNVLKSIHKITGDDGLGMSPKRITLSTSGVPKMIKKFADDATRCKLAVSLHSAISEKRKKIMPFTEQFSLEDVMEAMQYWYATTGSKITFEYVVWKGINDTKTDALALVNYAKKVPCKINIIEYNSIDDPRFVQAEPEAIELYRNLLQQNHIDVFVRKSRGKDIDAACGQLANKNSELTEAS